MWESIISWENLLKAYQRAAKGKRGLIPAAAFEHQLADHLLQLRADLVSFRYAPGAYTNFTILEPKRRKISAAPFRDRVVHHALCNLIGKDTHRAIACVQAFARRYRYVLRADIVRHFPSLDHTILAAELYKTIADEAVQWLIAQILASGRGVLADEYSMVYFPGDDLFAANRPRGLPIGNLTSQFWSNCYLNPFDWFVQRGLGCSAYVRYVDDFALFSDSKRQLAAWKQALIGYLGCLRLTIHEREAQVIPVSHGIPWLGWVVYPTHQLLKRRNVVNFRQRLSDRIDDYEAGQISFAELDSSVQGWINHVRYGDTWGLREQIFQANVIHPRISTDPGLES